MGSQPTDVERRAMKALESYAPWGEGMSGQLVNGLMIELKQMREERDEWAQHHATACAEVKEGKRIVSEYLTIQDDESEEGVCPCRVCSSARTFLGSEKKQT